MYYLGFSDTAEVIRNDKKTTTKQTGQEGGLGDDGKFTALTGGMVSQGCTYPKHSKLYILNIYKFWLSIKPPKVAKNVDYGPFPPTWQGWEKSEVDNEQYTK